MNIKDCIVTMPKSPFSAVNSRHFSMKAEYILTLSRGREKSGVLERKQRGLEGEK